jgi:hypothetical protein
MELSDGVEIIIEIEMKIVRTEPALTLTYPPCKSIFRQRVVEGYAIDKKKQDYAKHCGRKRGSSFWQTG